MSSAVVQALNGVLKLEAERATRREKARVLIELKGAGRPGIAERHDVIDLDVGRSFLAAHKLNYLASIRII